MKNSGNANVPAVTKAANLAARSIARLEAAAEAVHANANGGRPRGPDECWLWTGTTSGNGYGQIRERGKPIVAHRAVFASTRFVALDRAPMVIHSCDSPLCCNPRHLR